MAVTKLGPLASSVQEDLKVGKEQCIGQRAYDTFGLYERTSTSGAGRDFRNISHHSLDFLFTRLVCSGK